MNKKKAREVAEPDLTQQDLKEVRQDMYRLCRDDLQLPPSRARRWANRSVKRLEEVMAIGA